MTQFTGLSWINFAQDAVITAGSEEATLAASNVATDQGSPEYAWQTLNGDLTAADGATLTIKPTTLQQTWRGIVLAGTNLTAGATLTFTLKNYASPSDTTVATSSASGPPMAFRQVCHVLSADTVADYLVISIDDAANPDGHVNVPLVHCGGLWLPEYGRTSKSSFSSANRLDRFVTLGGQEFNDARWEQRVIGIDLDAIAAATEHWPSLAAMERIARLGRNVLAIPDIASATINQEAVLGTMTVTPKTYGMRTADRLVASITVTERL